MEYSENTKELWDDLWSGDSRSLLEYKFNLMAEEQGVVWQKMTKIIGQQFSDINKLNIVELGAGRGYYSALMSKLVNKVTMIDYSDSALEQSKEFYQFLGISNIEYINADALDLPSELHNKYDISMSFGLAEHFNGKDRTSIIKSHFDVLDSNGISFISVPNIHCFPYRIWKKKREITKRWHFGIEIPYSRNEFQSILNEIDINNYTFIGSSFLRSFNFIFPFANWKRSIKKRIRKNYFQDYSNIQPEMSTPLDSYLGYALVLCGKKK